jgi:AbrB family looped-hinge helix DNA binding protein
MTLAQSRVTAQGQISIPSNVRTKLGVGPGSILEWAEEGDQLVVRRAGRYNSDDIHNTLFERNPPAPRTLAELKAGIARHVRKRHGRKASGTEGSNASH